MSQAAFSNTFKKHIALKVKAAAAHDVSDGDALKGLLIPEMRKIMSGAPRHTSVESSSGWATVVEQFNVKTQEIKGADQKRTLTRSAAAKNAIAELSALNFDTFTSAVAKSRNLTTKRISREKYEDMLLQASGTSSLGGRYEIIENNKVVDTILILPNIEQTDYKNTLISYIKSQGRLTTAGEQFLQHNLQAGHLAGMAALKLTNVLGIKYNASTGELEYPTDFSIKDIETVDHLFNLTNALDTFSSNTHDLTLSAFSERMLMGDGPIQAITQVQLAAANENEGQAFNSMGGAVKRLSDYLIKYPTSASSTSVNEKVDSLIKSFIKLSSYFNDLHKRVKLTRNGAELERALKSSEFIGKLIESEHSPSIPNSIALNIASIIKTGKSLPRINPKAQVSPEKIIDKRLDVLKKTAKEMLKIVTHAKKQIAVAKQAQKKSSSITINKPVSKKSQQQAPKLVNLANLQALLNQALPQQIKGNMGTPALNNRTGRFAESVKVENISESRAGMISMFYSYMKSPYATFSQGGKQYTTAREPKTLISKSIREIASGLVGNRLRAISL